MIDNRCPCGKPAHHGGICSFDLSQMDLEIAERECMEDLIQPDEEDDRDGWDDWDRDEDDFEDLDEPLRR